MAVRELDRIIRDDGEGVEVLPVDGAILTDVPVRIDLFRPPARIRGSCEVVPVDASSEEVPVGGASHHRGAPVLVRVRVEWVLRVVGVAEQSADPLAFTPDEEEAEISSSDLEFGGGVPSDDSTVAR